MGFNKCGVENAEETPGILRVAGGFEPRSLVFALFNPDAVRFNSSILPMI